MPVVNPIHLDDTDTALPPIRFENPHKRRYYEARVFCNLFGEWEVFCSWGGIGTQLGNSKVWPATDYTAALTFLNALIKRRHARGYLVISR